MKRTKKKTKKKVPAGYDSILEHTLHNNELKGWNYHPDERIPYVTTHTYEPDFTTEICVEQDCSCTKHRRCGRTKDILVEVKGRFRDRKEATKYIFVRESINKASEEQEEACQKELVFIFQDANKPMPFAGKRKDGTKQTHGEWAQRNGFRYYCLKEGLPKKWLEDLT